MVTLVTGATGDIGKATCLALAAQGHSLFITGRNVQLLQALHCEIKEKYEVRVNSLECDVNDKKSINSLFKELNEVLKRDQRHITGLVHCAGELTESLLMMTNSEQVESSMHVNLHSAIYFTQQTSRLMMRNKCGVITLISSIVAQQGAAGQSVYGAAKAGLAGFVRSSAKELGPMGIRVNTVSPGFIETDMVKHYDEIKKQKILEATPLKRLGKAEDVAELIVFLHSGSASFIHGQDIGIDGGLVL